MGIDGMLHTTVIIGTLLPLAGLYWDLWTEISYRMNYNYKNLSQAKRIGMALHTYHQRKGTFPPAYLADSKGRKLHSWRTLLLEVENPDIYSKLRLSEPWNSDHNKHFESSIPFFLVPPSGIPKNLSKRVVTDYFVLVETKSAFPGARPTAVQDVVNDKSTTILVFEAPGHYVHWMEPVDFDGQSFTAYYGQLYEHLLGSVRGSPCWRYHPGICMVDGTVEYNPGYSLKLMRRMLSIR